MSEIVIKVENVGKKYMIGHKGTGGYKTLREQMFRHAHNLYSRTKKMVSGQVVVDGDETEEFWALKELNFDVKKGRSCWHYREKWCREKYIAKSFKSDHRTDDWKNFYQR